MKKNGAEHKGRLTPEEQLQQKPNDFLIVGIGASAGGIQALQAFFRQVPEDSGMAYVVILHLSPDHDSQLAGVLQRDTKIPVSQVTEKTIIAPDHVYVVPPDRHLTMEDGYIAVSPNLRIEERRAPVDIFFRTLADQHGPRAVSVVLSGTGANGSMGLKRVKERGGATFVQNPREAEFNEMPRNSIATDLVDEVLNVAEIPAKIMAYKASMGTVQIALDAEQRPEDQQQALREIFTLLRHRTGHDFSNYKRPTLLRRIERRISVRGLTDLPAYAKFLQENGDEPTALLKDLLISVTNFFRDKKSFDAVEQEIIPLILNGKTSEDQVRIWVAGCATGEEAYSFSMLCLERLTDSIDVPKLQIFATDIDESAIAHAREGFYTLNDAADVSPERLRRFFNKEGDGYRIRREVRETVMFATHNFLKDPPFSHLDLVSCRNVMIYLNQVAQDRALETFHFALNPGCYLFLGNSESVDGASDLYAAYSRENHIFQSRQVSPRAYPVPESTPALYFDKFKKELSSQDQENKILERISFGDLHQQLLEEYAPPSLVVNEEYEILHLTERAGKYLQISGGELSQNLLKLVKPELRLELRSALYQAVQRQSAVEARGLKVIIDDHTETINVQVRPVLRSGNTAKGFMLIIFEPTADDSSKEVLISSDEPVAMQLEEELGRVKAQLRASNEQHDFQAEEMKASNEELQAMNEELRSAAEELETSKEELQSINEELRTVNQELKVKIEETSIASNNLQNLINSTNIGTIFLDRNFRIVLFTPAIRDIFNLRSTDYGRPLSDITTGLDYDNLLHDVENVLEKLVEFETEVSTKNDSAYLMRVTPYRTDEDRIKGVVITFLDITERKKADEALRNSEQRLQRMVNVPRVGVLTFDYAGTLLHANDAFVEMVGYSRTEFNAHQFTWRDFTPPQHVAASMQILEQIKKKKRGGPYEKQYFHKDGSLLWMMFVAADLEDGTIVEYAVDVSDRKFAEQQLQQLNDQLEQQVVERTAELHKNYTLLQTVYDTTLIGMSVFEPVRDDQGAVTDFKIISVNKTIERTADRNDLPGKLYSAVFPGIKEIGLFGLMVNTIETGEPGKIEYRYTDERVDRWYSTMFVKGEGILVSTNLDITERKLSEEKRLRDLVLLQQSEEIAGTGSWDYDLLTGKFIWSDGMYRLFNLQTENEIRPEIYLQYATADCRETAARVVRHIERGDAEFEETLKIEIGGTVKVVKLKAAVLKNAKGQPVRVLGVDMDVTATREAGEKLRHMEAEQQLEIFRVTLRTQEEERRRISESLHNGLGQLLYGIKISLSELTPSFALQDDKAYDSSKRYTDGLLIDAIKETRRISHELMPMVLDEFGLTAAIHDICEQLQDGVKFHSRVQLKAVKLDKYLELAVYRTVQELMLNVVKHAEATKSHVEIGVKDGKVTIRVDDNGKGLTAPGPENTGIGLASIRSKANLLNGSVNITSAPGEGTVVEVWLPLGDIVN